MPMPKSPETPFHEGDTVEVKDHRESRENTCYAHRIGEHAIVLNPTAGSIVGGRVDSLVTVKFDDGTVEGMFHWRLRIIHKQVMWEV